MDQRLDVVIRRDFLPADLQREIANAGIEGAISVQARQSFDETRWLLQLANEHEFIKGIVGWVPLADANVREHLDGFAGDTKLKGVRHIVQDEPDDQLHSPRRLQSRRVGA